MDLMFRHGMTPTQRLMLFKRLLGGGGSAVLKTATGAILHITDALAKPAKKLVVNLEPVQSGEGNPSPENIRPISGYDTGIKVYRTSYNLIDQSFITEASGWALSEDEGFTTYGELNAPVYKGAIKALYNKYSGSQKLDLSHIKLDPNKKYYLTYTWRSVTANSNNGIKIVVYYDDGTSYSTGPQTANQTWTRKTVTIPIGTQLKELSFNYNSDYTIYLTGFAIVEESAFNAFDDHVFPSNVSETLYQFPEQTGTVYSGTLTVNEDGSGELVVDKAFYILDGETNKATDSTWSGNDHGFLVGTNRAKYIDSRTIVVWSSHYVSRVYVDRGDKAGSCDLMIVNTSSSGSIRIRHDAFESGDTETALQNFNAYLAEQYANNTPVQILYILRNEITYTLTSQQALTLLKGENNIWADNSDDLELTYYADGNVSTLEALNTLLGGRYTNLGTPDDVSDKEALQIILGETT